MDRPQSQIQVAQEHIPRCVRCLATQNVNFQCSKCEEFYCSFECQRADWPKHKRECFPMPHLISVNLSRQTEDPIHYEMINKCQTKHVPNVMQIPNISPIIVQDNSSQDCQSPESHQRDEHDGGFISTKSQLGLSLSHIKTTHQPEQSLGQPDNPSNMHLQTHNKTDRVHTQPQEPIANREVENRNGTLVENEVDRIGKPTNNVMEFKSPHAKDIEKKLINLIIPSNTKVVITHVISTKVVYVLAIKDNAEYLKTFKDVSEYGKMATRIPNLQNWSPGNLVFFAAPLEENNFSYGRAMLIELAEHGMARCAFIDYGYVADVPITNLRILSDELIVRPRLTRKIILNESVFPDVHTTLTLIKDMCERSQELILKYDGEFDINTKCNLFPVGKTDEVSENVTETVKAVAEPTPSQRDNESTKSSTQSKQKLIPDEWKGFDGANISLVVLDTFFFLDHGVITAVKTDDMEKISKYDNFLNEYCKTTTEPYMPSVNEYVIVKFENGWYRGQCFSIKDHMAQILFIDFGNITSAEPKDIRRFSKTFCYEIVAGTVMINGICNENKKAREYLLANMPDIIKFENLDFNKTDDMSVGMSNQLNKILSIGGFD